jgi:RNA polymerase sigma factor (sigma-70 family)
MVAAVGTPFTTPGAATSLRCPRYETPLPPAFTQATLAAREALDAEALFRREMQAIPLLSEIEERRLALRMRRGDEDAKRQLFEANLRLAWFVAGKFASERAPQQDVAQEAALVMWRKMHKYDPERGRFTTYMITWLRVGAKRAAREMSSAIRRPLWVHDFEEQFWRLLDLRLAETGEEPTEALVDEILDALETGHPSGKRVGYTIPKSAKIDPATELSYTAAWEASAHEGGRSVASEEEWLATHASDYPETQLGADVMSELAGATRADVSQHVARIVGQAKLTEKEGAVLALRYAYDCTLQRAGDLLRITRERVRQLEARALAKLRLLDTDGCPASPTDPQSHPAQSHPAKRLSKTQKLATTPLWDVPPGALAALYAEAFSIRPSELPAAARAKGRAR